MINELKKHLSDLRNDRHGGDVYTQRVSEFMLERLHKGHVGQSKSATFQPVDIADARESFNHTHKSPSRGISNRTSVGRLQRDNDGIWVLCEKGKTPPDGPTVRPGPEPRAMAEKVPDATKKTPKKIQSKDVGNSTKKAVKQQSPAADAATALEVDHLADGDIAVEDLRSPTLGATTRGTQLQARNEFKGSIHDELAVAQNGVTPSRLDITPISYEPRDIRRLLNINTANEYNTQLVRFFNNIVHFLQLGQTDKKFTSIEGYSELRLKSTAELTRAFDRLREVINARPEEAPYAQAREAVWIFIRIMLATVERWPVANRALVRDWEAEALAMMARARTTAATYQRVVIRPSIGRDAGVFVDINMLEDTRWVTTGPPADNPGWWDSFMVHHLLGMMMHGFPNVQVVDPERLNDVMVTESVAATAFLEFPPGQIGRAPEQVRPVVMFPLHLNGNHWVLGVADYRTRRMTVYDSMRTTANRVEAIRLMTGYLDRAMWPTDFIYITGNAPRQTNSADCGPWMMMNALAYARDETETRAMTTGELRLYLLHRVLDALDVYRT